MTSTLTWYHYALLGMVTVAALAFAWAGKMDVSAAFGIAGTAAGLGIPTAVSGPDAAPLPAPAAPAMPPSVPAAPPV